MSEISSWDEAAANNNSTVPDGWPESQLPSTVNDCAREMMAAGARLYNRSNVTISSTGSANAYVLTYTTAPTYTHGAPFSFKASFANTGAATVNVNALGAKSIVRADGATALLTGDILDNQHVVLSYDSALDKMVMISPVSTVVTQSEGADVASATTTNIWADAGQTLHVTGTTTITSLGTAPYAGAWKKVIFDGALILTHGANLSLPGSANITTAAGDMAFVYADTTTQFDVLFFKKSGVPVSGGLTLLQTATASASATIDLETGIGATYDDYVIIADGVRPATDTATLQCRVKAAGAYITTASYHSHIDVSSAAAATYSGVASATATSIQVSGALDNSNSASNLCFTMRVYNVNSATLVKGMEWTGVNMDASANAYAKACGMGSQSGAGAVQGVQFFCSTGNISVGTFRLYGVVK